MQQQGRMRGRPRAFTDKTEQNKVQAVDRAIDVLDLLASEGAMSLSEIAKALEQPTASTYRILVTFEQKELVELLSDAQVWQIGSAAFRIGAAFLRQNALSERGRPIMRHVMESIGETVNLGIERNGQVMVISQIECDAPIRACFPPGTTAPLHASGIGKALLTGFSDMRLDAFLHHAREKYTERTLTYSADLRNELREIDLRGYAVDDEERNIGMRCIAAPVYNHFEEIIAGLSISGPSSRITKERLDDYGSKIASAANRLSMALGAGKNSNSEALRLRGC